MPSSHIRIHESPMLVIKIFNLFTCHDNSLEFRFIFLTYIHPVSVSRCQRLLVVDGRDEHGFGFGLFPTGFRLICRIWIGLGFEILAITGFGFGFRDFLDNFVNMLENVEMTHEPNSSFRCYAVIIHSFRS